MTAIIADELSDGATARLRDALGAVFGPNLPTEEIRSLLPEAHALIVRTRTRVTEELLGLGKRLRVVGRAGVGLDNVDLEAARRRGIPVVHTPEASTEAVADLAIGLMLGVLRSIPTHDRAVREGAYSASRARPLSQELGRLAVGIVGLGRIGKAVARRCRNGFGARVLFCDVVDPGYLDFVAERAALHDLLAQSDIVTLHVPLNDQTRHMISRRELAAMKPGGILVNTARGEIVDEAALMESLEAQRLGAAALDVFEHEPLSPSHPLLRLPNVVLTPHIGAKTLNAEEQMSTVADDVLRVLRGSSPRFPACPVGGEP